MAALPVGPQAGSLSRVGSVPRDPAEEWMAPLHLTPRLRESGDPWRGGQTAPLGGSPGAADRPWGVGQTSLPGRTHITRLIFGWE